jgi:hypothetical protein
MKTIYIAGPMKGYENFNFAAFDAAEACLRLQGWEVINPAQMDREVGFDPNRDEATPEFMRAAIARDVDAIYSKADAVALLPGWERSVGATAEMHLARWCRKPVYLFPKMVLLDQEDVLDEAMRITGGDRHQDYGDASVEFLRVAQVWGALLGITIQPEQVPLMMIGLKCCRQMHRPKRDGWTDIAGYARCGWQATASRALPAA